MEHDKSAAIRALDEYYQAFSTLDVRAVLPFFHEPALLISPLGAVAVPTPAAIVPIFAPVMETLRAKGYARSELSTLSAKPLSATAVLACGVAVRYKADGQELERVGTTYVLNQAGDSWKIAVIVLHDADAAPRLD